MVNTKISEVKATEILDSRGTPTISVSVTLECGAVGKASVPSGASTGKYEAHEKRDGEARYFGKGTLLLCRRIEEELLPKIRGLDASRQNMLDGYLLSIDGTENRSNYGANALLALSLAASRAAAAAYELPLYRYLGGIYSLHLPTPMMNVINGGAHAGNNLDIQEFMIVPIGLPSFAEKVRACTEIYATLRSMLGEAHFFVGVGDEGGFAPDLASDEDAVKYLVEAIERAGYSTSDIKIALDIAASEWYRDGRYYLPKRDKILDSDELFELLYRLINSYPIISVEDAFAEDDIAGWQRITSGAKQTMLVGDDLFVTDAHRIYEGKEHGIANAVLIKPNQRGTLSEAIAAVSAARRVGYKTIVSHRSGDTSDDFIADLAAALGADFIKAGAPARGERIAKYNRLLEIEKETNKR